MDSAGECESNLVKQKLVSIPPLREMRGSFRPTRPLPSKQRQPRIGSHSALYSLRTIALIFVILLFGLSYQRF